MQQSRPLPSSQRIDEVGFTYPAMPVAAAGAQTDDISAPTSVITSPLLLFPGTYRVVNTEDLTPISEITTPTPTTGTLSLTAALQSTMNVTTKGRIVIIPGSSQRKSAEEEQPDSELRMSRRLRHGIVLSIIAFIMMSTLFTLSPLASGQASFPVFTGISNWVHAQQANWDIVSHESTLQPSQDNSVNVQSPNQPPLNLPKSQYVAIAQQDAMNAGISPDYFVRQIELESGFNPNAYSFSGAEGIAQFMPGTAAGLGINPWDPIQALRAAAHLMASYAKQYGGNYAMALAAYNGGTGTVQYAVNNCGSNWMNCLPGQTRNYIRVIMGI